MFGWISTLPKFKIFCNWPKIHNSNFQLLFVTMSKFYQDLEQFCGSMRDFRVWRTQIPANFTFSLITQHATEIPSNDKTHSPGIIYVDVCDSIVTNYLEVDNYYSSILESSKVTFVKLLKIYWYAGADSLAAENQLTISVSSGLFSDNILIAWNQP